MLHFKSLLFTPGNRSDRFAKGLTAGTDALVLDWEDGVSIDQKEDARQKVIGFFQSNPDEYKARVGIRLNSLDTNAIHGDVQALLGAKINPGFIMLAKTEGARDIEIIAAWLGQDYRSVPIIILIESLTGLDHIEAATQHPRVQGVGFGPGDLSSEMGVKASNWAGLVYARQIVAKAAHKAGILAIDGPCLEIKNIEALEAEIQKDIALGFEAKMAIHPAQVKPINSAFAPTSEETAWASMIIKDYEAHNQNAYQTASGEMIDKAIVRRATALLKRTAPEAKNRSARQ